MIASPSGLFLLMGIFLDMLFGPVWYSIYSIYGQVVLLEYTLIMTFSLVLSISPQDSSQRLDSCINDDLSSSIVITSLC